jgi:hypothetical protein
MKDDVLSGAEKAPPGRWKPELLIVSQAGLVTAEIRKDGEAAIFVRQEGDILMLDNMWFTRVRNLYLGARKIPAAISEPFGFIPTTSQ